MGLLDRIRAVFSPSKLTSGSPVARAKPLWEQFQRIGGGLVPADVSNIIQQADSGQPARLVDLFNETRQKDGHIQGICGTRDRAVALCELAFVTSEDPRLKDKKAEELCARIVREFENWPTLVEHLTGSYGPGHATAEILWRRTADNLLLPYKAVPLRQRDFIFHFVTGELRYAVSQGDLTGTDLLADNPGRIVQVQRRIVGDAQVREGLIRILVWMGLLRNWGLRDWVALGEIGWKPWRLGKYKPGTAQKDIDKLVEALELIGSTGVGAFSSDAEAAVEWPKGIPSGTAGSSTHRELFETLGREASKAVLGQTTSTEPGPNGDRASTQTRDLIRLDIRESDAIAVAAALRAHLFAPAVALNRPAGTLVPVPWFQTDESVDQLKFAEAVAKLKEAGCRIPAKWVRDEVGMPEPKEGEELLEPEADPENDPDGDEEDEEPAEAA